MKSQELRARGYVSFEQNMPRKKRRRFERFWHFGQYVSEDSKYASEYPENGSQRITL
jgi:hypothetical protein